MTILPERWLLDTNVWIFGLRRDNAFSACAELLDRIGEFSVLIPLQVMKELSLALAEADAVIAAHAEQSDITTIVSENRQFLQTLKNIQLKSYPLPRLTRD